MSEEPLFRHPLLDAIPAVRLLHVPRSTLYELVRSRGLPHVRIGERGLRFTRSDLEAWIADHTYGGTARTIRPRRHSAAHHVPDTETGSGTSSRKASDTRLAASSRSTKAR
jgi:excisionase family DNA binding protein